jgi:hypothetical protein
MIEHYFLAVSLGAAVVAGALLGVVAVWLIAVWRENRR